MHEAFLIKSSFAVEEYSLRSSWILNYEFNIHVVNDIMQHRFIKKRNCIDKFTIATERKMLAVNAYEIVMINIQIFIDNRIITLINVAYISNFMINIVFESILKEKKLHFNILHRHLHRNEQSIVFIFKIENHYVIKNNIKNIINVFITKVCSVTKFESFYKWHQLFVHSSSEIIEHFI